MNDFDYDAMCKKRIAKNAFNHVNARRGKCKLPHEYLTRKELNALNGEVKTYDLGKPMDLYEFRGMPDDLKKQYLEDLQERFHANDHMLGEMFGCGDITAGRERIKAGVKNLGRGYNAVPSEKQRMAWQDWLTPGWDEDAEETDSHVADAPRNDGDEPTIKSEEMKVPTPTPVCRMEVFNTTWEFVHSWEELYAIAKQFPFPDEPVRIEMFVRPIRHFGSDEI